MRYVVDHALLIPVYGGAHSCIWGCSFLYMGVLIPVLVPTTTKIIINNNNNNHS